MRRGTSSLGDLLILPASHAGRVWRAGLGWAVIPARRIYVLPSLHLLERPGIRRCVDTAILPGPDDGELGYHQSTWGGMGWGRNVRQGEHTLDAYLGR